MNLPDPITCLNPACHNTVCCPQRKRRGYLWCLHLRKTRLELTGRETLVTGNCPLCGYEQTHRLEIIPIEERA